MAVLSNVALVFSACCRWPVCCFFTSDLCFLPVFISHAFVFFACCCTHIVVACCPCGMMIVPYMIVMMMMTMMTMMMI